MTEQTTEQTPELKRYTILNPDDVTLGQAMGIKAATGIDVFDPESTAHQIAAMIWLAGREDGLTIERAMLYTTNDFDVLEDEPIEDVDPLDPAVVDAEDPADPTAGPGTEQL